MTHEMKERLRDRWTASHTRTAILCVLFVILSPVFFILKGTAVGLMFACTISLLAAIELRVSSNDRTYSED